MRRPEFVCKVADLGDEHPVDKLRVQRMFQTWSGNNDDTVLKVIDLMIPWVEAIDPPERKSSTLGRWWWQQCAHALGHAPNSTMVAILSRFRESILGANGMVCRSVESHARIRRASGVSARDIQSWITALCDAGLIQPKNDKSWLLRQAGGIGGVAQAIAHLSTPRAADSAALKRVLVRLATLDEVKRPPWSGPPVKTRWPDERQDLEAAVAILLPESSIPSILHGARNSETEHLQVMGALARYAPEAAKKYIKTEVGIHPSLTQDPELARLVLRDRLELPAVDDPQRPRKRRLV